MTYSLKPDAERNNLRYLFFRDRNGWDEIAATESVNPWWQASMRMCILLSLPRKSTICRKNLYLLGEMTGNQVGDTSRMTYDAEKEVTPKHCFEAGLL